MCVCVCVCVCVRVCVRACERASERHRPNGKLAKKERKHVEQTQQMRHTDNNTANGSTNIQRLSRNQLSKLLAVSHNPVFPKQSTDNRAGQNIKGQNPFTSPFIPLLCRIYSVYEYALSRLITALGSTKETGRELSQLYKLYVDWVLGPGKAASAICVNEVYLQPVQPLAE